jgi:hypothetical protein
MKDFKRMSDALFFVAVHTQGPVMVKVDGKPLLTDREQAKVLYDRYEFVDYAHPMEI